MITDETVAAIIMGHAVGDALGVPVEFTRRDALRAHPVKSMRGHGTYDLPAGSWSDDTSMTLAVLDSIGRLGRIDYDSIMTNFLAWLHDGAFTPGGEVFDIGNATRQALYHYDSGAMPLSCGGYEEGDNGNGSLMRMAPIALYLYEKYDGELDIDEPMSIIHDMSALTHAHPRSQMACGLYVLLAAELLAGEEISAAVDSAMAMGHKYYAQQPDFAQEIHTYDRLWDEGFACLPESVIKSSGYVVDTLEAVIWCLLNTASYKECVLRAVNLGADTDTIAAIAGGLAGLAYGLEDIPQEWLETLIKIDDIENLCRTFAQQI